MDNRQEKIRRRAYELWEQADRTGYPQDHWLQAEREIANEDQQPGAKAEATVPDGAVTAAEAPTANPILTDGAPPAGATSPVPSAKISRKKDQ